MPILTPKPLSGWRYFAVGNPSRQILDAFERIFFEVLLNLEPGLLSLCIANGLERSSIPLSNRVVVGPEDFLSLREGHDYSYSAPQ